jgi:hypothetical protein
MLSRHAGSVQRGAWHVVLVARGADRKTAAVGIRAVIDEPSCAVGWRLPISPATVSRTLPRFGPLGHRITAVARDRATNSGVEILIQ